MEYFDYRTMLGVGFDDKQKRRYFLQKMCNFIGCIDYEKWRLKNMPIKAGRIDKTREKICVFFKENG